MRHRATRWLAAGFELGESPVYRCAWGTVALLTSALAALGFVAVIDPRASIVTLIASIILALTMGIAWAIALEAPWRTALRPSLVAASLIVCFCGLSAVFGAWSFVLAPIVLTSPRLLGAVRRRRDAMWGCGPLAASDASLRELLARRAWVDLEPGDAHDVSVATPLVTEMSVPGLCRLWRRTSADLAGSPSSTRRLEVVGLRAELLEEMARRDPRGFGRWLQVGSTEADPGAYLRRETPSSP